MPDPMVSATAFSKAAGVSERAIADAIKHGRLQAYSKSGRRVSADFKGPKRLKLDEAQKSFDENRTRLDDSFLEGSAKSGSPLVTARTKTSNLQAALLQMRLARELGDVIPKGAAKAALESLGRAVQRAHKAIPGWAEEIAAAAQNGGVGAVSGLLRAKSSDLLNSIADMIAAEAECGDQAQSES
jgi:hypothetical protein